MNKTIHQFADALAVYDRQEKALSVALTEAGFDAPNASSNELLTYVARQIAEKGGMQKYSLNEDWYDYSRSFAQQVEDYAKGNMTEGDTLVVGKTPEVFQQIGLSNVPMVIDQTHVDYAINGTKNAEHYIGQKMLSMLPQMLEEPIAIIESETRGETSVVAIVSGEVDGKQVMAAVKVQGNGTQNGETIDANVVTSIYGRQNLITKLLTDAINKENTSAKSVGVYYINKSEARSLYARSGVQFPGTALQDGLNHSIYDAGSPVNREYLDQTETRQFQRWFKGSKVVNEDGSPKVMYHGTREENGEFYVFDNSQAKKKGGLGFKALGEGNYFTSKKLNGTERYGSRVLSVYLAIKKPLEITQGTLFKEAVEEETKINVEGKGYREIQDILRSKGYDGVILYEGNGNIAIAVTFDSTQIKSATDNIGLFDEKNPDIRYSLKDEEDTADRVAAQVQDDADFWAEMNNNEDMRAAMQLIERLHDQKVAVGETGETAWREEQLDRAEVAFMAATGSTYNEGDVKGQMKRLYMTLDESRGNLGEAMVFAKNLVQQVIRQRG